MSPNEISQYKRASVDGSSYLPIVKRRLAQSLGGVKTVVSGTKVLVIRSIFSRLAVLRLEQGNSKGLTVLSPPPVHHHACWGGEP